MKDTPKTIYVKTSDEKGESVRIPMIKNLTSPGVYGGYISAPEMYKCLEVHGLSGAEVLTEEELYNKEFWVRIDYKGYSCHARADTKREAFYMALDAMREHVNQQVPYMDRKVREMYGC